MRSALWSIEIILLWKVHTLRIPKNPYCFVFTEETIILIVLRRKFGLKSELFEGTCLMDDEGVYFFGWFFCFFILEFLVTLNKKTYCRFHQILHVVSNILQFSSLYASKYLIKVSFPLRSAEAMFQIKYFLWVS